MRNCDKCSKEELIAATGVYSHPAVANGKPISCGKITCNVCDLDKIREGCNNCGKAFISWLYSEAEPEKEEDKGDPVNHPSHYIEKMMTNEELYKDEAEKIAKEDNTHHPAVYKGKPASCIDIGCRRCDLYKPPHKGCSECYTDWLKSEAEPEKPVSKEEIKVGDTVKVTTTRMREGKIGTVRSIHRTKNGTKFYYVRFDGESCGHATFEHEIEKVKPKKTPPRIVVHRNGDTVTAKDLKTGETASAVCSKDDIFDFHTGAFIAMARLTNFMDDINVMWKEMEHADSYIDDIKMRFGYLMGE